jgi:hypothetical protein
LNILFNDWSASACTRERSKEVDKEEEDMMLLELDGVVRFLVWLVVTPGQRLSGMGIRVVN